MTLTPSSDHGTIGRFDRHDLESLPQLRAMLAEGRWTSQIYHAIDIVDKAGVALLSSLREGTLNARRYLAIIEHLRRRHCDRMLEVGVWRGDTSELLIRNSRNAAIEYHGVDVFDDTTDELIAREVSLPADSEIQVRARLARVSARVRLHRGLSREVLPRLRNSGTRFNLIWLDGGHSYETVKEDFANALPLLDDQDGTIFFDDYTSDPYLPDVKRFIDAELLGDPGLVVDIHDRYVDHYRGHDYQVVSVRRRVHGGGTVPAADDAPLPAGFYYHLVRGVATDDLPWEAPYLLSQARWCLDRGACVEYACSLLERARPFLASAQLVEAARALVRQDLRPHLAGEMLLQALGADVPAAGSLAEAEELLLRARRRTPLDAALCDLATAVDETLDTPGRFIGHDPDAAARGVELGVVLRGRLRLEESQELLADALARDPSDERALREHLETMKALTRRAHRARDWRQAERFQRLVAGLADRDEEWQQLLAVTKSLSPADRDVVAPREMSGPEATVPETASRTAPPKFCSSFWTEGVLLMTGELQFCCRNPTPIGNYEKDGLEACWHSDVAREMRRKVVAGEYPDAHCEACHRLGATYPLERPLGAPFGRLVRALEQAAGTSLPSLRMLSGLFRKKELDEEAERVLEGFEDTLTGLRQHPAIEARSDVQRLADRLALLAQVVRSFLSGDEAPPVVAPAREVNLIAVCNARCVHCIGNHYDQLGKGLPGPNGTWLKTIGPETHRAALEHPDHIFEFWCNGTEFLIYPRWKDIYQSLAQRQILLSLSTNGIALTEDAVRTLVDGRALAGLNVSLDGATAETVEAIRVNVRFDDLVAKLRFLVRYAREREAKFNVNFTFTIMRRNHQEIPRFVELVHSLFEGGAPIPGTILFTFLQPEGNRSYQEFVAREHHSLVDEAELRRLLMEAQALVEQHGLKANVTYNHAIQDFAAMGFPFPPMPTEASRLHLEQVMLDSHPPQRYGREIPWEMPTQLCLSDFLRTGQCAIDVGANVGGLSIAMSRMVGPDGHVHSFEANPRLLPVLRRDLALNGAERNVTTVGLAAWSTSGETLMLHCDERPWAQGSSLVYNVSGSRESVQTIRLDDYVRQHGLAPAAVKLDVEGAEFEVLTGAEAMLREHAPVVALEYWPRGERDPLDLLEGLGYRCFDTNRYIHVDRAYYRRHPLKNIVANVIAVPGWADAVYRAVTLEHVAELAVNSSGLRTDAFTIVPPGRYRASVHLDGPENESITLVLTSGDHHLVVVGGSVAEVAEWGQAGLVFQVDEPTTLWAEVFLSGAPATPVRLSRVAVSKVQGIRVCPSPSRVVPLAAAS